MDIKTYLNNVCKEIKYEPAKKAISEELELHIKEVKENYISDGIDEKLAEEKAVNQMGNAEEIGKSLNKIHKPQLDWKLLILIGILMGFSLFISILKEATGNDTYFISTISYMLIGFVISILIYLSDYRKLKKHSLLLYIFATIILLWTTTNYGGTRIRGIPCINLFGYSFFFFSITVTLYIISFIVGGFISVILYGKVSVIWILIISTIIGGSIGGIYNIIKQNKLDREYIEYLKRTGFIKSED